MPDFNNPSTRVKLNPETYLKFDGTETLLMKNLHSDQGVSIKYDIMLILYELINWTTVEQLTAPWPPDDQQKIIDHLGTLHEAKLVISDEAELADAPESGLSDNLGSNIHINVENHHHMLRDYIRMAAYRRAIERAVRKLGGDNTIAMDLGCGSGVLGFFAARAGAKKVFAIEKRPDIILLAEELAKANKLDGQIEFIQGSSGAVRADQVDPKPNLFISEILGNGILEENVLEFTIDARERFLAEGAQLIPGALDIYMFAFDCGTRQSRWQEVRELKDLYGFDFELMGQVLCQKTTLRTERYSLVANKTMSDPALVKSLNLQTLQEPTFVQPFELEALEDGHVTSFCGYFKAHLDEETILTNSPWAPPTHWTHLVFTLPEPKAVKRGEKIKLEMLYDGSLRVRLAES